MQTIDASTWLSQAVVEKLGWVLVHSFWQLTAIALLAWLLDRALQRRSSSVRYWSLLLSLLVMMASPVVTWLMLPTSIVEDVAAVSDANPGLGLMLSETPLPATNMEPTAPAKEIRTTAAEIQKIIGYHVCLNQPLDESMRRVIEAMAWNDRVGLVFRSLYPTKDPQRSLKNLGSAVDLHKDGKKKSTAPARK